MHWLDATALQVFLQANPEGAIAGAMLLFLILAFVALFVVLLIIAYVFGAAFRTERVARSLESVAAALHDRNQILRENTRLLEVAPPTPPAAPDPHWPPPRATPEPAPPASLSRSDSGQAPPEVPRRRSGLAVWWVNLSSRDRALWILTAIFGIAAVVLGIIVFALG